ncbi:hypothetical protein B0H11DRAFT_2057549 [Mycena galericulata]|nr:hypothetical protein B0H11DRAFT_2057549 [Mycena galericulata]
MSDARVRPCKLFLQGRCKHGDKCKFVHQAETAHNAPKANKQSPPAAASSQPAAVVLSSAASSTVESTIRPTVEGRGTLASPQTRSRPKKGEIPCRAWREGECLKGAKCWFAHDPQVQEAERLRRERAAKTAERMKAMRAEQAAREAFQAAEMERQRVARIARLAEQEAAQRARQIELEARKAEMRRKEATQTIQHIVLGSSLVTFNAGLSIQEVVAGFETCRIQIKNLPRDAKNHEIKALFTQQGVDPARLFIAGIRESPDGHLEATLITTSEEGGAIAVGLEDIDFRQERLHFEVAENATFGGMGNSARNSDTLTLSWRAPSSSVVATFDTVNDAMAKVKVLDRRVCAGRQVHVEMNQPPPGFARGFNWQCAIKITGLPRFISPEAVTQFTGSHQLKFLKPIAYDVDAGLGALRQVVEVTAGRALKSFDVVTREDMEGNVTLEMAKQVHDSLVGKRLYYLGNCSLRLRLPDPLQYILSIPTQQYQAQKRTWDSLTEGASNKAAYIRIFPVQHTGKMQIKVLGEDKKAVGSLKVRVENLASGEQLAASCWHRSFRSATGARFLTSVFERTGAYARADWKLCLVKVYGDSGTIDKARDAIKAEVERLDSLEWTVFLKKQSVRFFMQRGLAVLKETLGEDNASLIISPRAKVVIRGGEEARHILTKLIDESLEETAGGVQGTTAEQVCPICYDEISHPVTLACDHTYCNGCLRHYISNADSFPLTCLGNEATCESPIPIPTIEKFLPTSQFHQLLETAFLRYVERHPQEFKYCKTPDCSQVYHTNTTETAITCPSCFLSVCSSCDEEGHEGMSCAASRLQRDPGEQERRNDQWARANGVKRCPTCSVWIEKTEGCNHMTCKCGAHICWVCLRVFDHEDIYPHLSSAHGGAFGVPPEEAAPNVPYGGGRDYVVEPLDWEALNRARVWQIEVQEAEEAQARILLEERRRIEAARRQDLARQQEIAYQERVRLQAAAAEARRRERESGWGCVVM